MFEKVKKYYDAGLYTADMVRNFYLKGKISYEEYLSIINNTEEEQS